MQRKTENASVRHDVPKTGVSFPCSVDLWILTRPRYRDGQEPTDDEKAIR